MEFIERSFPVVACLGVAALAVKKFQELANQDHTFAPSPTIASRSDRFKVLAVKAGEPLKAPFGEFFLNKDGLYIHFRRWLPQGNIHPLPPKGIVVIIHGLGEHCARYDHVARGLNAAGFVVYGLDHQGHGRSEGDRLHLHKFEDFVDDVMAVVEIAKNENKLIANKTFILAHSLGGLIGITTLEKYQSQFAGAVISSPATLVDPSQVNAVTLAVVKFFGNFLPKLPVDKLNISTLADYMPVLDHYQNEPLVFHGAMSARIAHEMLSAMSRVHNEIAPKITLPYILIHSSEDKICNIQGSVDFHSKSGSKDKKFEQLKGGHELMNEKSGEAVTAVVNWLKSKL
jgi:acylglycerol lipase